MALENCTDCGHLCSKDASSCPNCGAKWPLMTHEEKKEVPFAILYLILLFVIPLIVLFTNGIMTAIVVWIALSIVALIIRLIKKIF
jgi:hypothetical protein